MTTPSNANTSGLVDLIQSRIGQDFEDECHLAEHEAREIISVLVTAASAQAKIAELEALVSRACDLSVEQTDKLLAMHDRATAAEARADRLAKVTVEAEKFINDAIQGIEAAPSMSPLMTASAPIPPSTGVGNNGASPLPEGGGQCSGITGELDPRLVEWGYASLGEAITHLGKMLDDQAAFDGLGGLIAELKEARYLLGHVSASTGPAHDLGVIAVGYKYQTHPLSNATYDRISAFLARNGKGEG